MSANTNSHRPERSKQERGQTTISLVGVLALAALLGLGLVEIAHAMVHRSNARAAADAVALASVVDDVATAELLAWYRAQGIIVEANNGQARASSGPSQAHSFAALSETTDQPAPVVVAVVARAEQLLGTSFGAVRLSGMGVELSPADAALMQAVAGELGLCPRPDLSPGAGWEAYEVC